jgi:AraC-like DNA-binding protein
MTPPDVLFVTACGIGTVNSLFLAAYLLRTGRGDRRLNRLFAAILLIFSFRVGKSVAMLFLGHFHPVVELLWIAALAATGLPALLYAHYFTGQPVRLGRSVVLALAAALASGALLVLLLPLGTTWRLMAAALAVYGAAVAMGLRAAAGWWNSSGADRLRRRWLVSVGGFLGAAWVLHAALIAWRLTGPVDEDRFFHVEAVLFSLAVYLLVYLELRRGLMAQLHQPAGRDRVDPDDPMLQRLRNAVEDGRLFLDPALSLPSLARRLRLSPQHVSRLVNAGVGCSFNDYVNRLRVEEACRILAGPDGTTRKIGALAYDCGFGSPSVFYAAFRKFTGRTPSDYLTRLSRT